MHAATAKPFKSSRSAKTAMTKAIRAYDDARNVWATANFERDFAARDAATHLVADAFDAMSAVYNAAQAQGFWVRCIHCDGNPTSTLIAQNMD